MSIVIAPLKSLSKAGAGWVVSPEGASFDLVGRPLVLPPDCGGTSDCGTSVLSTFLLLVVRLGGIFCKRVMPELGKNFHRAKLYRMRSEYERSKTIHNVLYSPAYNCGSRHTHKKDSTRHSFIDSLGLFNLVL